MYIAYPRIARTFALTKKEKMEKRIKTVWILTIITAILIIGGQGYWLHHQYCYSTKTFMQELHKQILQLEKEEMNTRYDKRTNNHKYTLSYKIEMPDSVNQNGKTTCIISFYRPSFPQLFYPLMTRQFFCDFHEKSEDFCVS